MPNQVQLPLTPILLPWPTLSLHRQPKSHAQAVSSPAVSRVMYTYDKGLLASSFHKPTMATTNNPSCVWMCGICKLPTGNFSVPSGQTQHGPASKQLTTCTGHNSQTQLHPVAL